ncbi:NAD-dependent epimerase/dehydratase family protein, partial [Stenotrophomonas sp. SrG]|uniref:NAD-dependent epimerase/dehydratase family protein n=1 Tax=Stenotrophomonas sp. SrG TaxID=3414430 RepID=UPI003CF9E44B
MTPGRVQWPSPRRARMDILSTGGTGFLGQRLCQRLRAAGHRVPVLPRRPGRPGQAGVQYVGARGDGGPVHAVVN